MSHRKRLQNSCKPLLFTAQYLLILLRDKEHSWHIYHVYRLVYCPKCLRASSFLNLRSHFAHQEHCPKFRVVKVLFKNVFKDKLSKICECIALFTFQTIIFLPTGSFLVLNCPSMVLHVLPSPPHSLHLSSLASEPSMKSQPTLWG